MTQRLLTTTEIEWIISGIKPVDNKISEEASISSIEYTKSQLRKQLKGKKIYPNLLDKLKKGIEKNWHTSLIQPGENVGVITGQSIGEKQTQITLDSFHKCGSSDKKVTQGVPRFSELLMATKSPKMISGFIYFNHGNNTIKELRETIGDSIVELTLKKLIKSYEIKDGCTCPIPKWYKAWSIITNKFYTKDGYTHCLSLKIDTDKLYTYKISLEKVCREIESHYQDIFCVWSPDFGGRIDIWVDTREINLPENRQAYTDSSEIYDIYLEEVILTVMGEIIICGITGISQMYFNKEEGDGGGWMIETDGVDLHELFCLPHVNMAKTRSNNVWDIYNTLGIEASRQFLIDEFMDVLGGINVCHVKLLVERMTYSGSIGSISRFIMRRSDTGPFGKASFEETMDNFLKAGIYGHQEPTTGASASIICGKLSKLGTGLCQLKTDINKLLNYD